MTQTLDEFSALLLYLAMGVYAISFIAFTLDLAKRAAPLEQPAAVSARAGQAATAGGMLATAVRPAPVQDEPPRTSRFGRVGMALAALGFAVNLDGTVLRGIADLIKRKPIDPNQPFDIANILEQPPLLPER